MNIKCPTCRKQIEDVPDDFPHRPFCSSRCKWADLGKWLNESYTISTPLFPEGLDPKDPGRGGGLGIH